MYIYMCEREAGGCLWERESSCVFMSVWGERGGGVGGEERGAFYSSFKFDVEKERVCIE